MVLAERDQSVIQQDVNEKVGRRGERKEVEVGGGDESDHTLILYLWFDRQRQRPACCPQGLQSITPPPPPFIMIDPPDTRATGGPGVGGHIECWVQVFQGCHRAALRFRYTSTFL